MDARQYKRAFNFEIEFTVSLESSDKKWRKRLILKWLQRIGARNDNELQPRPQSATQTPNTARRPHLQTTDS
jgi:hypothetical protein